MNSKIIVITLNYNQNKFTIDCIHSLLKSDYDDFELLLIDNGSEDNSYNELSEVVEKLSDKRIILKRIDRNVGYTGGINYGLKTGLKQMTDYFLIMNNDTVIDKSAISSLVSVCKEYDNKAIVTGKVYWYDKPDLIQNTGVMFSLLNKNGKPVGLNKIDKGQYDVTKERDMIDDIFWLFPATLITKIGTYSEDYWFNFEQADFAMRAKKVGFKLIYTHSAKLWHKAGASIGGRINNPIKTYYHIQSNLIYFYKNFNIIIFFYTYLRILAGLLKSSLLFLIGKFDIKQIYAMCFGIIYFHKWVFKKNRNDGKIPPMIQSNA